MIRIKLTLLTAFFMLSTGVFSQQKSNQPNTLSKKEKKEGFKLLYDGYSATGWRSAKGDDFPAKGWAYSNGELKVSAPADAQSHHAVGGDIVSISKYKYFDFSLEYNIAAEGNSGLKYFVTNEKGSSLGLEFQILDDTLNVDAQAGKNGNHKSGALYDMIPAKTENILNPPGSWNKIRLVVYPDNRVEHHLNGVKVLEYVKGSKEFKKLLAESKYSTIKGFVENEDGHLLLQDHGSQISFRNLKIRELN